MQDLRSAAHSQQQQEVVAEPLGSLIPESLSLLDSDEELAALHARVQQVRVHSIHCGLREGGPAVGCYAWVAPVLMCGIGAHPA